MQNNKSSNLYVLKLEIGHGNDPRLIQNCPNKY
jgi:hypothetical protein